MSHTGLLNSLKFSAIDFFLVRECQSPLNYRAQHHSTASDYPVYATVWANISLGCKKMDKERNMSLGFWSWQKSGRPNGMLIRDKDKCGNLTLFLSHRGWSKWLPLQVEKPSSHRGLFGWSCMHSTLPLSLRKTFFPHSLRKLKLFYIHKGLSHSGDLWTKRLVNI